DPVAQRAGVPDAVERARRYVDAGADCVYPILLTDLDAISAFITGVADANVNLMCRVGEDRPFPSIAEATSLGAARLSVGGQLWRAQLSSLARLLDDLAAS
ncbi:MAG: isocitrate lyase/phosphoenolpyruvate mutase family protein, partial [Ilumatobacteraceae bacterium]